MSETLTKTKDFFTDIEKRFVVNEKAEIGTLLTNLTSKRYGYKFNSPTTKLIIESENAWLFEDVGFVGGDKAKDIVFEEKYVNIATSTIDIVKDFVPNSINGAIDQDNII
ncbi:UNVERIFIED_CONTAM: hypothetical protein Sindi_1029100 [Sesamum indicum]